MSFSTAAFVGAGQTFEFNGDYILSRITDVTYSGSKVDTADTTDTSVGQAGYKTFIAGLQDAGDVSIKGIWYPGDISQEAFKATLGNNATFVHTLPNNLGTLSFAGLAISFDHTSPMEKAGEYTAKIKISGAVTYSHS
jgi:Lambda phage tail tube protein, TTP